MLCSGRCGVDHAVFRDVPRRLHEVSSSVHHLLWLWCISDRLREVHVVRRLSKIGAAAYFGKSPSTPELRIDKGELKTGRDSLRGKVWVIVDYPVDGSDGRYGPLPDLSNGAEILLLRERVKNLETVLSERHGRQRESDAVIQQPLQELHAAHQQADALTTRLLPPAPGGRQRWWPFSRLRS